MKFILGQKIGMSQVFQDKKVIPVTLVAAGPCWVVQKKDEKKDGYQAVKVGFIKKGKKYRYLREFKANPEDYKEGQEIKVDIFQPGEEVKVQGISKGKGFQGAVKRWGFSGQDATHGGKRHERTLGSVGSAFPQRVVRGRKMPGRMGHNLTTVRHLKIVEVDAEHNLLAIKGAIPGPRRALIKIETL